MYGDRSLVVDPAIGKGVFRKNRWVAKQPANGIRRERRLTMLNAWELSGRCLDGPAAATPPEDYPEQRDRSSIALELQVRESMAGRPGILSVADAVTIRATVSRAWTRIMELPSMTDLRLQ